MVGLGGRGARRKDGKVKRTIDGEKTITTGIEWEIAKSWWQRLWISEIVKRDKPELMWCWVDACSDQRYRHSKS